MKSIIVYFSQTGNTEKIAHSIYDGVKKVIAQSDISRIKDINPRLLIQYDLIGIGTPWWGRIPANVRLFIKNMESMESKHVFPFMTHGSLPAGSMQTIIPLLKEKGLKVIGLGDWYGNSIQQFILFPHLTAGHPDDIDLKEAADFGAGMARLSQRILNSDIKDMPELPSVEKLNEIYGAEVPYPEELTQADALLFKQRKIDLDKCTKCGICVENCHTNSIDLSASPVFKDTCDMCWFCEQICPEGAIEMQWESYAKIHDGFIGFLNEHLKRAEAQNRFRRLVPPEKVGWNTHWYQISGYPRFVAEKNKSY